MPFIEYGTPKKFRTAALAIIETANDIIEEYESQGFILTLRQLYYQFVARALIENTEKSYKRLGGIINDARLAGLIDWFAIEDRTRWLRVESHWSSPNDIVRACANQFQVDRWENQRYRPEVWIEKDALIGVIEGICTEFDIPYFACRGYVSQSEVWASGRRMRRYILNGQTPVMLHFGDHDPSGMDMTRDNDDRLSLFSGDVIDVRRLALNMTQVEQYNPPPNPAKITDSRAKNYILEHGDESWELDALEPSVIADLIREEIEALIDPIGWDESQKRQDDGRARLLEVAEEM